jgi:hypothetical protein
MGVRCDIGWCSMDGASRGSAGNARHAFRSATAFRSNSEAAGREMQGAAGGEAGRRCVGSKNRLRAEELGLSFTLLKCAFDISVALSDTRASDVCLQMAEEHGFVTHPDWIDAKWHPPIIDRTKDEAASLAFDSKEKR